MTIFEKIMITVVAFNIISWFAFLQHRSFVIWAELQKDKYSFFSVWYVVWFYSTIISGVLLTIDFIWSFT